MEAEQRVKYINAGELMATGRREEADILISEADSFGVSSNGQDSELKRSNMTNSQKGEYIKTNGSEAYMKLKR